MRRIVPTWLTGYAGVILVVAVLVNLVQQLSRIVYGLILPSMEDGLNLSHTQAGGLVTAASMMGIVAAFVFGMLAPRYGSRFIIGLATLGNAVGMALMGASFNYPFALVMGALVGFTIPGLHHPSHGADVSLVPVPKPGDSRRTGGCGGRGKLPCGGVRRALVHDKGPGGRLASHMVGPVHRRGLSGGAGAGLHQGPP